MGVCAAESLTDTAAQGLILLILCSLRGALEPRAYDPHPETTHAALALPLWPHASSPCLPVAALDCSLPARSTINIYGCV